MPWGVLGTVISHWEPILRFFVLHRTAPPSCGAPLCLGPTVVGPAFGLDLNITEMGPLFAPNMKINLVFQIVVSNVQRCNKDVQEEHEL